MESDFDVFPGEKKGQTSHKLNGSQNEYINDISIYFVSLAQHKAASSFKSGWKTKSNRCSQRHCDHPLTEGRAKKKKSCETVGCVNSNLNKLLHV